VPDSWDHYFQLTNDRPPRDLLVQALPHARKGRALDLGCGAGVDSEYLVESGFDVTAVDGDAAAASYVSSRCNGAIHFVHSPLESFDFGAYDLVASLFTLSFLPRVNFELVVSRSARSLSDGGIMTLNAFGPRDGWASSSGMTFLTADELAAMVGELEILELSEEENDGQTANGEAKHWHVHNLIAVRH
jgi:tellurite methyltransferase